MNQKQKLSVGLAVIAVMLVAAVVTYFWSAGKIKIGAAGGGTFNPTSLSLTVDQLYPVEVSGGSLPYGGYISTDPTVAEVESWYSYSVADNTTTPALSLVVKGIKAGSTSIKIWDQAGTISELPVTITATPGNANSTVKFAPTTLKINVGEQCQSVLEPVEGASEFWTTGIVSDPSVIIPSRFGGITVNGATKAALRVYGAKVGTSSMLIKNATGNYAKFDVEVVASGGTCENVAWNGDATNLTLGSAVTFSPTTAPQLSVGQMLAVKSTAAAKSGGFIIDKPNILALDSWNAIGSTETINYITLRGVSAGTANLYYWDQAGSISKYTVTVAAPGEVNTKAAFSPTASTVKVGEESDLIVELNSQASQWVSMIAGDSKIAIPVRFGGVQKGDQVKLALRVKGIAEGKTSFSLIHKDGNVAKVDVTVSTAGGDDDTGDDTDDTSACTTNNQLGFTFTPNAWNIKTYNFKPASDSMQLYNVFGFLGAEKPVNAFIYPGTGQSYKENGSPAIGEGFWFSSGSASPICIPADRAVASTQKTAPIKSSIAMVGNPTQKAVKWGNVTITIDNETMSLLDASNKSKPLVKAMFTYQPGASDYVGYYASAYKDFIENGGNALNSLMSQSVKSGSGVWIILNSGISSATLNFP